MTQALKPHAKVAENPRALEIRKRRVDLGVSQRQLAKIAGLPGWKVPWTEQGIRPDYTDQEYKALLEALTRAEKARKAADRVLRG